MYGNELLIARSETGEDLILTPEQRGRHLYVAGETGSGKSKFLEYLIRQDIVNWRDSECGVLLLDWHGPIYDGLMRWLASNSDIYGSRPVIPIDLRRDDWVVSYNVLRQRKDTAASVVVDNLVDAVAYVWGQGGTSETPRLAKTAATAFYALYESGLTLKDALKILTFGNRDLRAAIAAKSQHEPTQQKLNELNGHKLAAEFNNQVESTVSRLQRLLGNDYLRCTLSQPEVSFDFRSALDEGAIVLVSLATAGGNISQENAKTFATLMLADLWTDAAQRGKSEHPKPKPFYCYVDEFQEFVTPTIAQNLDQARGFGLHMTLANQFPSQLLDASAEYGRRLYRSVMGNTKSKLVFSISTKEDNLEPLADWLYTGTFDPDKVKHEIYSTKVMGYEEEVRRSTTVTKGKQNSHATPDSPIETAKSVRRTTDPETGKSQTEESTMERYVSGGGMDTEGESESEGYTDTPVLIPIMGQELSSRQYAGIDEQRFAAQKRIMMQPDRHATLRCMGMTVPAEIRTKDVDPGFATDEMVEEYRMEQLAKWPFALPIHEAHARLEQHAQLLVPTPAETEPEELRPTRRIPRTRATVNRSAEREDKDTKS